MTGTAKKSVEFSQAVDTKNGAVSKVGYFLDSLSSLKLSLYIVLT